MCENFCSQQAPIAPHHLRASCTLHCGVRHLGSLLQPNRGFEDWHFDVHHDCHFFHHFFPQFLRVRMHNFNLVSSSDRLPPPPPQKKNNPLTSYLRHFLSSSCNESLQHNLFKIQILLSGHFCLACLWSEPCSFTKAVHTFQWRAAFGMAHIIRSMSRAFSLWSV
jgi:hypothetical protein